MKQANGVVLLCCLGLALNVPVFAGGAKGGKSLVLAHNKVEIDQPFKAYAEDWGRENGVDVTIKTVGGGGADLATELKASYAAGEMPDIFAVAGIQDFKEWEGILTDLSQQKWVKDTSVALTVGGKVYGFPVAIEGWGMAYNTDILDKAGVDPASLNNLEAYRAAFAEIDAMKEQLGLKSVVSMAASAEMFWVTAHHNLNSYLANGLKYGDLSITNLMLDGKLDETRFREYADWVELLFKYSDPAVLRTGNYDAQVNAFVNQQAAFIHQGNWIDPNIANAHVNFPMAFAPHGSMKRVTDGIFVSAPSYYVVNKDSKNKELALKFLDDLVYTTRGQKFMVEDAGMIPAFGNITLQPKGPLSRSVQSWSSAGKVYSWDQYYLSDDFRNTVLGPIYNQFALGQVDKQGFIDLFTKAVADIKQYQ